MGVFRLYKAGSPFNAVELPDVDFVQSFDVMYLAHINHAPTKLTRAGHTDWSFSEVTFGPTIDPPTGVSAAASNPNTDAANSGDAYFPQPATYVVTAIDSDTGQESRASDPSTCTNDLSLKRNYNTITLSEITGVTRYRFYKSNNQQDYGFIGSTTITPGVGTVTFRDDYISPDLTVGPLTGFNPFTGSGDWPSTVVFFEQRLWWARTENNPNAVYSSRSADYENMDVGIPGRADDAIAIRLVAEGVNQANQLVPLDHLLVFSSDGIFKIEGSNDDYLAASPPPRVRLNTATGASRLSPIVIDQTAFYKTINSAEIRAAGYEFQSNGYKSSNIGIFSPDFFEGFDIVSWAYAQEPLSVIWCARSDGALLAFTWEKEQDVWGWTICPLPNGGKVKSLCSIPEVGSDNLAENRIYAIIEFEFAGSARQVRCRMASGRWFGIDYPCHLDCATSQAFDDPVSVIPNLWHLEGETVAAYCNGIVVEGLVVADGSVVLPEGMTCTYASVGFPYDAEVETVPLSLPVQGTNAARRHLISQAVMAVERSRLPEVAIRRDLSADIPDNRWRAIRSPASIYPNTDERSLSSGLFPVTTDPITNDEASICLRHRIAPLTVTGIYLDPVITGD